MMRRKRGDENEDERCEEAAPSSRRRPTPRTEPTAVAAGAGAGAAATIGCTSDVTATGEGGGSVARRRPPPHSSSSDEEEDESDEDDENSDCPISYLPQYLRPIVRPYHSDFFATASHSPRLVAQLMSEGFLPIATRRYLLPKLHARRCCISLPDGLHVSRSVRKKAKRWSMSVNSDFDGVVSGCHAQHGINWLYPPVVAAFKVMNRATISGGGGGVPALLFDPPHSTSPDPHVTVPVRLYSIEVYNVSTGDLAAGELGYTVGSIYTSLTGFSREDGAGSVQLAALGTLLGASGFETWDLGMHMDYKERMGARLVRRGDYVNLVHRVRVERSGAVLRVDGAGSDNNDGRKNCRDILSGGVAETAAVTTNGTPAAAAAAAASASAPGPWSPVADRGTADANDTNSSKPAATPPAPVGGGLCRKKRKPSGGDDGDDVDGVACAAVSVCVGDGGDRRCDGDPSASRTAQHPTAKHHHH